MAGIRHRRQLLSLRVHGERNRLVLSAFESLPGEQGGLRGFVHLTENLRLLGPDCFPWPAAEPVEPASIPPQLLTCCHCCCCPLALPPTDSAEAAQRLVGKAARDFGLPSSSAPHGTASAAGVVAASAAAPPELLAAAGRLRTEVLKQLLNMFGVGQGERSCGSFRLHWASFAS